MREKKLILQILFMLASAHLLVAVQVRFMMSEASMGKLYYLDASGDYEEIKLLPYEVSEPIEVRTQAGKIGLYREVIVEQQTTYQVVLEARISPFVNALGIIYKKADGWHLSFYDDSASAYPPGAMRLINLVPVRIYNRIGDEMVQVEPYGIEIVSVVHKRPRPITGVISAYKKGDELVSFYNKPVVVLPNARLTCISVLTNNALEIARGAKIEDVNQKLKVDYFLLRDGIEN